MLIYIYLITSGVSDDKERNCLQWRRPGFTPWSGRSPGEGNGYPLLYSCLENPMDREAWWLQSMGSPSWTWLSTNTQGQVSPRTWTHGLWAFWLLQVRDASFAIIQETKIHPRMGIMQSTASLPNNTRQGNEIKWHVNLPVMPLSEDTIETI